ncbi:Phosphoenolpyruvate/pyruvate domain-containing protein [Lepidopterella palustris CBS 459.81]|uniref:Phosphoenolpyruvate/pyruvate domain-containing protein n=1 Tax=Lepidopterella palustris CBS 459.81 TaxID=1314670 RepID=A0A8E2EFE7_9PEZI|nr:Phosphoenolpyruvate/pyruvate domain-containing protein [Lepidopterella palustris CBS 459.81]
MYSDGPASRPPSDTREISTFSGRIKESKPIVGAAISIGSVLCAQIVARAGFDWVMIDMEHAPTSPREATYLTHAVIAASAGKCVPIIRAPSHGVEWIKWALDSGSGGIVIPMVTSAKETEDIIQRAIYPPLGQRSFGPFLAPYADTDDSSDVAKYITKRVKDLAIMPTIESVEGVEKAEEILSVKGVTGCFIGPFDLRQSLGLPGGDGEEPSFIGALEKVLEIGKRLGLHIGTVASTESAAKRKTEMGFSFLLSGQDPNFLAAGAKASWQQCDRGKRAAML